MAFRFAILCTPKQEQWSLPQGVLQVIAATAKLTAVKNISKVSFP
jgi:hypothetical protein